MSTRLEAVLLRFPLEWLLLPWPVFLCLCRTNGCSNLSWHGSIRSISLSNASKSLCNITCCDAVCKKEEAKGWFRYHPTQQLPSNFVCAWNHATYFFEFPIALINTVILNLSRFFWHLANNLFKSLSFFHPSFVLRVLLLFLHLKGAELFAQTLVSNSIFDYFGALPPLLPLRLWLTIRIFLKMPFLPAVVVTLRKDMDLVGFLFLYSRPRCLGRLCWPYLSTSTLTLMLEAAFIQFVPKKRDYFHLSTHCLNLMSLFWICSQQSKFSSYFF